MMRRRLLCALLVSAFAAPLARAQDPRISAAVAAARDWLLMTDHGDAAESYKRAGSKFRAALTLADWQTAVTRERTPRGSIAQRALVQTAFEHRFPGIPDGEYAMLQFRTAFAKQADAGETVTLEREPDGTWRVIGYVIK